MRITVVSNFGIGAQFGSLARSLNTMNHGIFQDGLENEYQEDVIHVKLHLRVVGGKHFAAAARLRGEKQVPEGG